MGDDVFGLWTSDPNHDRKGHSWYGIEDYADLLAAVFDPNAVIELEFCHSADGTGSIAYAFKKALPSASAWGYTGKSYPFWPIYDWETIGSGWHEVTLLASS
jgi:hypothetical protein